MFSFLKLIPKVLFDKRIKLIAAVAVAAFESLGDFSDGINEGDIEKAVKRIKPLLPKDIQKKDKEISEVAIAVLRLVRKVEDLLK